MEKFYVIGVKKIKDIEGNTLPEINQRYHYLVSDGGMVRPSFKDIDDIDNLDEVLKFDDFKKAVDFFNDKTCFSDLEMQQYDEVTLGVRLVSVETCGFLSWNR